MGANSIMTHLKELLTKREQVFDDFTAALLEELSEATAAAGEVVGKDVEGHLVWTQVAAMDNNSTLIIAGQIEFALGEVITTDEGEEITITEELQPVMNRIVRVGIPMEMAETGSRQEIVDYLKAFGKQDGKEMPVIAHEAENTDHHTVADLAGEFRSAGLTQEQIASMLVFAEQSTGKVN